MESKQSAGYAVSRRCVKQLQQHAGITGQRSRPLLQWTCMLRHAGMSHPARRVGMARSGEKKDNGGYLWLSSTGSPRVVRKWATKWV